MDRPKQLVPVVLALLLLTGGAVLLLYTHRTSTSNPIPVSEASSTRQLVEPQPHKVLLPATEAIAPKIAQPAPIDSGFRGQVIDAVTRKPVKEFEVTLVRIQRDILEPPIKRGFKSASGRFTWRDITPGNWRVTVSATGYQVFSAGELQLSEGKITGEIVMPLLRGFAIRGRVSELTSGRGIADATISFRKVEGIVSLATRDAFANSHENGAFVLDGVPGGDIVISASAPKHAYREIMVFVDDRTPEQEITLSSGATIAGIVMTTSGGPAKGKIHVQGPGPGHLSETTDAGEFSFRHMPAGRYRLSADTSAGSTTHVFELQQDEIKEGILLVVGAGRSIRGLVTGLRPEQFQHVALHLHSESNSAFFSANPDISNPKLSSRLGVYEEGCGLDKVDLSWGHDEYIYHVVKDRMPEEALYMLRYHSFYPGHREGEYDYLLNDHDRKMFDWVRAFNPYDLYTKSHEKPDVEKLKPFYMGLIQEYLPGKLSW